MSSLPHDGTDLAVCQQVEVLCKQLYESQDSSTRVAAEKALVEFSTSPDCLNRCKLLMDRADSPYSQVLAASTLTKLIGRPNVQLPVEERLALRNYILQYLAQRGPKLPNFVSQALVTLFGRITKLGWYDVAGKDNQLPFRDVTASIFQFLQEGSAEHSIIGVQLLSQLVSEMNTVTEADANRSLTKHRKIASSFRDSQLFEIFQHACQLLKDAVQSLPSTSLHPQQLSLANQLLRLALNCLTFDFIGTSSDESSDDLCTVQIPTSWRTAFLDFSTLQLFFDLYHGLPDTSLSSLALSCLVQIASVRRSLFNNTERAKFLNGLVAGVKDILLNPRKLTDPSNYHEFCRLLARLKSNYQLGELVKVDSYTEVIELIAKFTVTSLGMHGFAPNSVHYLLSLWQRMVASVPYVKASEPHLLETYTPEVTQAYITSRLESVAVFASPNPNNSSVGEDPLEDLGQIQQQLDQISTIGRCEYERTCSLLIQLFDENAQRYASMPANKEIEEGRLTWLVYIIGAVIGGRVSFASTDEHDNLDGELVVRVLQLMSLVDAATSGAASSGGGVNGLNNAALNTHGSNAAEKKNRCADSAIEKLDLAMLSFFEQFRKIYVGDQVQKTSKVYRKLSEVLGLQDEAMVLSVIIQKIITNLKFWGASETIITKTLQLLNDLSVGYSSVRKLIKLDAVQFMLNHHTSDNFPFLGFTPSPGTVMLQDMRCRTTFYTALGRLLMVDLGEDEERFENFMIPLTNAFDAIGRVMSSKADLELVGNQEVKRALIGLARDLRGVAFAFNTKTSYMMLFEWLYPTYTPILLRAVAIWFADPTVTTPILKLMAELVQNRSQRLMFDVSSPNGFLLFRETSKMMVTYGSRILTMGDSIPKDSLYSHKLKGVSICFNMLKHALCGSYVNFGVFRLYGDNALDDTFNTFVKLLLSISQSDLLDYPKLSQTYYALLECLAQDHMVFLATLEPNVFLYILSTISEGLASIETMVSTGCCATLDHVITFFFKKLTKSNKKSRQQQQQPNTSSSGGASSINDHGNESEAFLKILEMHPEILQQMLSTVIQIIMFEDCRNQWSMSRPLLGLVLLNEKYFGELRQQIISGQPTEKQAAMAQCFENLMDGIERNLLTKNRDRFTQNLSVFRRDVNDSLKSNGNQMNGGAGSGISSADHDTPAMAADMMS